MTVKFALLQYDKKPDYPTRYATNVRKIILSKFMFQFYFRVKRKNMNIIRVNV
jgi:hypothetical protein